MGANQIQSWLLRLAGLLEILAFIAVVMPRAWMEASHTWLGLGELPDGPVMMFMIRQASYVYGMHGVSLWILASDVTRFRPIIRLNGISFVLAAPVFFLIDYHSGDALVLDDVRHFGMCVIRCGAAVARSRRTCLSEREVVATQSEPKQTAR